MMVPQKSPNTKQSEKQWFAIAIAAFTFVLALWGFRQGLIVGLLGLAGLVVGAALGSRLAPVILEGGSNSPYAPMFALLGAVLFGSLALAISTSVGANLRGVAVRGPLGEVVDGIGGALLMSALALGIIWVLGAVVLYMPGAEGMRRDVQRSLLLGGINDVMPQCNTKPSVDTPRGHQFPFCFLERAAALDPHDKEGALPLPWVHLDISAAAVHKDGPMAGQPSGSPVLALAGALLDLV